MTVVPFRPAPPGAQPSRHPSLPPSSTENARAHEEWEGQGENFQRAYAAFGDDGLEPNLALPTVFQKKEPPPRPNHAAYHAKTTAAGFASGLVVVVPVVLWMSGHLGALDVLPAPRKSSPLSQTASTQVVVPIPAEDARAIERLIARPEPEAERVPVPAVPPIVERLATARALFAAKDINGVRELLTGTWAEEHGEAAFLLAETFDPNVLAALGLTDVRAEVGHARDLYERALARGVVAAKRRLEALQ